MEVKSDKNFELNVDIDTVWNVLINPEKIVTCVPGNNSCTAIASICAASCLKTFKPS